MRSPAWDLDPMVRKENAVPAQWLPEGWQGRCERGVEDVQGSFPAAFEVWRLSGPRALACGGGASRLYAARGTRPVWVSGRPLSARRGDGAVPRHNAARLVPLAFHAACGGDEALLWRCVGGHPLRN